MGCFAANGAPVSIGWNLWGALRELPPCQGGPLLTLGGPRLSTAAIRAAGDRPDPLCGSRPYLRVPSRPRSALRVSSQPPFHCQLGLAHPCGPLYPRLFFALLNSNAPDHRAISRVVGGSQFPDEAQDLQGYKNRVGLETRPGGRASDVCPPTNDRGERGLAPGPLAAS